MTGPIKTNRILALCKPGCIQHAKETDDDVEFATDMEEPVCEGSEEHNHTTECHKRDYCRLNNSLKLVLGAVSNTEQLWRSF